MSQRAGFIRPLLIVLSCAGVYANSLRVPFLFDDLDAIPDNPRIRCLWPPWETVATPGMGDVTTAGRPVAGYSFAVNYAISGLEVWSYHVVNVAIHAAAALLLYGIVRRTVRAFRRGEGKGALGAEDFAFFAALLWALHPLQTESVTYIVQRAESLAGMLVLLTLYCVVRGIDCTNGKAEMCFPQAAGVRASSRPRVWYACAVAACGVGMGVKEIVAVTPVLVLLYDRTFTAGGFAAALRARRGLYAGLAATWIVLAVLLWYSPRSGMARGATLLFGPLSYLQIQCWAIPRYVMLAFWPGGLTFDYGGPLFGGQFAKNWGAVLPYAALVGAALGATLVALRMAPWLGFLGAWFFLLLAPSSSLVPLPLETVAEHRMYLPLAALSVLLVAFIARVIRNRFASSAVLSIAAVALGWATVERNRVYRDELSLWSDTAAKRPDNARARTALALALLRADRLDEGIVQLRAAIETCPSYGDAWQNLGAALHLAGRFEEAERAWRETIAVEPRMLPAYANLANLVLRRSGYDEAVEICRAALREDPGFQEARLILGREWLRRGDAAGALAEFEHILRESPGDARVHNQRGRALLALARKDEAIAAFRRALEIQPDFAPALQNLRAAEEGVAPNGRD